MIAPSAMSHGSSRRRRAGRSSAAAAQCDVAGGAGGGPVAVRGVSTADIGRVVLARGGTLEAGGRKVDQWVHGGVDEHLAGEGTAAGDDERHASPGGSLRRRRRTGPGAAAPRPPGPDPAPAGG